MLSIVDYMLLSTDRQERATVLTAPLPSPALGAPPALAEQAAALAECYVSAEASLEAALVADVRLAAKDRDYILEFFEYLGLRIVADLSDINALEPLGSYFRESLEQYEAHHAKASGAVRAALGRIVKVAVQDGLQHQGLRLNSSTSEATRGVSASTQMTASAALGSLVIRMQELGTGDSPTRRGPGITYAASPVSRHSTVEKANGYHPQKAESYSPSNAVRRRATSPPRDKGFTSSFGQHSPSTSRAGTFDQAGSRQSLGRTTVAFNAPRDTSPGPGAMYRPTIMCEDLRPASPKAVIGTEKRPELWNWATSR